MSLAILQVLMSFLEDWKQKITYQITEVALNQTLGRIEHPFSILLRMFSNVN